MQEESNVPTDLAGEEKTIQESCDESIRDLGDDMSQQFFSNMDEIYKENIADEEFLYTPTKNRVSMTDEAGIEKNDKLSSFTAIYKSSSDEFTNVAENDVAIYIQSSSAVNSNSEDSICRDGEIEKKDENNNPKRMSLKTLEAASIASFFNSVETTSIDEDINLSFNQSKSTPPRIVELSRELKLTKQKNSMLITAVIATKQRAWYLNESLAKIKVKILEEEKSRASANELAKALAKAKSKIEKDIKTDNLSSDFDSTIVTTKDIADGESKLKGIVKIREDHESQLSLLTSQREEIERRASLQAKQNNMNDCLGSVSMALDVAKQERATLSSALVQVEEEIKLLQVLRAKTGLEVRDITKFKVHQNPLPSCRVKSPDSTPTKEFHTMSPSSLKSSPTKSPLRNVDFVDIAKKKVSDLRQDYERLVAKTVAEKELFATSRDKYFCIKSDAANLKAMQKSSIFTSRGRTKSTPSDDTFDGIYEVKSFFVSSDRADTEMLNEADFFVEGLASASVEGNSAKQQTEADNNNLSADNLDGSLYDCVFQDSNDDSVFDAEKASDSTVSKFIAATEPTTPGTISKREKKAKMLRSASKSSTSSSNHHSLSITSKDSNSEKIARPKSMDLLHMPSKDDTSILLEVAASRQAAEENRLQAAKERERAARKIQEAVQNREEAEKAFLLAKQNGDVEEISLALAKMMAAAETECFELQSATQSVQEELVALKDARNVTDEAMVVVAAGMARYTKKTLASLDAKCHGLKDSFQEVRRKAVDEYASLLESKEVLTTKFCSDERSNNNPIDDEDIEEEVIDSDSDEEAEVKELDKSIDVEAIKSVVEQTTRSLQLQQRKANRAEKLRIKLESEAMFIRICREKEEAIMEENERLRIEEEKLAREAAENNDPIEEARATQAALLHAERKGAALSEGTQYAEEEVALLTSIRFLIDEEAQARQKVVSREETIAESRKLLSRYEKGELRNVARSPIMKKKASRLSTPQGSTRNSTPRNESRSGQKLNESPYHHSAGKSQKANIEDYGVYLPLKASQEVEDQEVFETFRRKQKQLKESKSPQQQSKSSPLPSPSPSPNKIIKKSRFDEELDELAAKIADARLFLEEMALEINMEVMMVQ
mmetsp:Transcript_3041/g.4265  ORF Transcript_3041/g.4265 Transcript_3041/m.4265 type:complete len:1121 (-) Transcript_3041:378-3740(-)|eukprot:CAMPEP_0170114198 /NCGR_PEP_ID=MMETSP0020_2-20130122/10524_1 /TAXON_ID=98059 /ORGANISM="Dinobryon sp., Strain UTEXLB2267" /LENGTH=1120 /DNA_ID=CAMNT_0010341065 /DNA_START=28 /DNA_END=3390 /DNA_ORIENTATION=+